MSNTKHTPLPWEVQSQGTDEPIFIIGPNPEDIIVARVGSHTSTSSHYASDIVQRADAELIVRACNAHDDLLTSLKETIRALEAHLDEESLHTKTNRDRLCPYLERMRSIRECPTIGWKTRATN